MDHIQWRPVSQLYELSNVIELASNNVLQECIQSFYSLIKLENVALPDFVGYVSDKHLLQRHRFRSQQSIHSCNTTRKHYNNESMNLK